MEQLTLEQAAKNYYDQYHIHSLQTIDAFKAGGEWPKEQYKELITLMRQLIGAYDVRYPDAEQLLVGYSNEEALNKLNGLLANIQD